MKFKVKKTLFFSRKEIQIIIAALDKSDGSQFPQACIDAETEGPAFEKACRDLSAAIRKEVR